MTDGIYLLDSYDILDLRGDHNTGRYELAHRHPLPEWSYDKPAGLPQNLALMGNWLLVWRMRSDPLAVHRVTGCQRPLGIENSGGVAAEGDRLYVCGEEHLIVLDNDLVELGRFPLHPPDVDPNAEVDPHRLLTCESDPPDASVSARAKVMVSRGVAYIAARHDQRAVAFCLDVTDPTRMNLLFFAHWGAPRSSVIAQWLARNRSLWFIALDQGTCWDDWQTLHMLQPGGSGRDIRDWTLPSDAPHPMWEPQTARALADATPSMPAWALTRFPAGTAQPHGRNVHLTRLSLTETGLHYRHTLEFHKDSSMIRPSGDTLLIAAWNLPTITTVDVSNERSPRVMAQFDMRPFIREGKRHRCEVLHTLPPKQWMPIMTRLHGLIPYTQKD